MNKHLTEARKAQGLTQVDLAAHAGLTQPTISRLEAGINCGHLLTWLKLAGALGVPMESIFPDN